MKIANYKPGASPRGSGMTILTTEPTGGPIGETVHLVRYDCCGAEKMTTRRQILMRISARRLLCPGCGRKQSLETRRKIWAQA